ncbi:class I histocompatibility antigen, F10 alpha chain-like isoform X3 [Corvus kubaryi]|nr:class I histocompatibility antigen, F10 alpha chain-like isoform X3 [Corvus kubaryi]XP_041876509.1 class I histocompatibility antigen, F10 alpha chain-like isoform X3 [Corvus kubaryi]
MSPQFSPPGATCPWRCRSPCRDRLGGSATGSFPEGSLGADERETPQEDSDIPGAGGAAAERLLGLLGAPGAATRGPPNLHIPPVLHSLRFLRVTVSEPSPGLPRFVAVGYVDGIPFASYNSRRGRVEPQTLWMAAGAEPGYWDTETEISERYQHVDPIDLEMLQRQYNQTRGLHTLQVVSGCDLLSNGSIRGSDRYGYDGRDFISFDLGSGSFVAADGTAQIIKKLWESDGITVPELKHELGHTCVEVLKKHVRYRREALERKEAPSVHVSGKVEHKILTLSCRTYGFYPSTIAVSWMKGDEIRDQETEWGGIVPNSDGTFHTWARIEARPEEREQYRCRVEHPGMPEPGIFIWEPESSRNLILVVTVSVIAAIVIILLIGFGIWKLQPVKRNGYNVPA